MTFETGQLKERPLVYLAGAISKCADNGSAWRLDITPHLYKLGFDVFNPVIEQPKLTGVDRDELERRRLSDFSLYRKSCQKVVEVDLKVLNKCSLVVCKLDDNVFGGAGTFGELTVASLLDIPVYVWVDFRAGLASLPSWAMGCITEFSTTKEDFYKLIPSAEIFLAQSKIAENVGLDIDSLPDI